MTPERIKELRQELGLSQVELARELGLTPAAISHYERDRRKISKPYIAYLQLRARLSDADTMLDALKKGVSHDPE